VDEPGATTTITLADPVAEGLRLIEAAQAQGLPLRLMGGVAVWVRCPSVRNGPLQREYGDIDVVSRAKARGDVIRFFERNGYAPDRLFNALHGGTRLIFSDPARARPADVIFEQFSMCHAIDLRERLEIDAITLTLADLLLTKLQIVRANQKDLHDVLGLLADHPLHSGDPEAVDLARFTEVTRDDWGLERTIRGTLQRVEDVAKGSGLSRETVDLVLERVEHLAAALTAAPKSLRWKLRARIGDRVRWYALPEEPRR
jgi:hypothetical protein